MAYQHVSAYGEFFSTRHIQTLAWYGTSPLADHCARLLRGMGLLQQESPTLRELVEAAYLALSRRCRVEYLFKTVALHRILYGRHSPRTTALFFEFAIGEARADLVVVNGLGMVIEVKTARDDLSRLPRQLAEYARCFGNIAVFVDRSDVPDVLAAVPDHVGVVSLSRREFMSWHRRPREVSAGLRHAELFRVLRKGEIPLALKRLQRPVPDVHPAEWHNCCYEEFRRAPVQMAVRTVHDAVRNRSDTRRRHAACEGFPSALWTLIHGARIPPKDWRLLRDHMERPYG